MTAKPPTGTAPSRPRPLPAAVRLNRVAPVLFVLLWSSSFLAVRVGLRHMSPLLFVALRMVLAAAILSAAMVVLRRSWSMPPRDWLHCAVAGVLSQAILLMTAHVAMVRTEAAPIALIQTLNPLLTALLAWPLLGQGLRASQVFGLFLGFAGVLLVLGAKAVHSQAELPGLLATAAGVCALCGGTLYYGRFCRAVPPFLGATVQMLACAAVCLATALLLETPWTDWEPAAFAGIAWNAVGISIGGMALYFLMLSQGTAARATVNFYLIPGVTSLMTWALLGEAVSPLTLLGLLVASTGCWLAGRNPAVAGTGASSEGASSP